MTTAARVVCLAALAMGAWAQSYANVLLVVNDNSAASLAIGEYYSRHRSLPSANICRIHTDAAETISREAFDRTVAAPIAKHLRARNLIETVLYIVTTLGVPLRVSGTAGIGGDNASVDSELACLYADLHGRPHATPGIVANPFFGQTAARFEHPRFAEYLVTRLAAYDVETVKRMIDNCGTATNRGRFVIDSTPDGNAAGTGWLRAAAQALPRERVIFDETRQVLTGIEGVIGYASWGSNDKARKQRYTSFKWLPGAIMTEFVSTDGRTFERPPANWTIGDWNSPQTFFHMSPQTMTADYLAEGASGASGHTDEPFLQFTPRPDLLLPAYFQGRNLAESYYLAIRALSWQNVVVGDPLCAIGPPR